METPQIRATHDHVVVRRNPTAEQTSGGIFIPKRAQEQDVWGTVLAIGSRCTGEIQPGDEVLIPAYGTDEMIEKLYVTPWFDGESCVVLRERDVKAKREA